MLALADFLELQLKQDLAMLIQLTFQLALLVSESIGKFFLKSVPYIMTQTGLQIWNSSFEIFGCPEAL